MKMQTTRFSLEDITPPITTDEVQATQQQWADAIVCIGRAYLQNQDYEDLASRVIDDLYGYDYGTVLFKPTKAAEQPFRLTREDAISYMVRGHIAEDQGFAIHPWSAVEFDNAGMILQSNQALAMGDYCFTDANGGRCVKAEFTFGYFRDPKGRLRIHLHHSSLPFEINKGHHN